MRLPVLLAAAACHTTAHAQLTTWWDGPATGNWSDASSWYYNVVPTGGVGIYIANNATVTFDIPLVPGVTGFRLGHVAGEYGHLKMSQGEFNANGFNIGYVGQGILEFSGTAHIQCTNFNLATQAGSSGSATINAGEVAATGITVGQSGVGDLVLNDGYLHATGYYAASLPGSFGIFAQTGGLFEAGTANIDHDGHGVAILAGGEFNVTNLNVGRGTTGQPGELFIQGTADITVLNTFSVGGTDLGTVTQTGGTVDTHKVWMTTQPSGIGTYLLQGGVLDANEIYHSNAYPTFDMTGGTLIVGEFGTPTNNLSLTPTGGLVLPGGKNLGDMTVHGDLDLGNAAAIRYQLDTPANSDLAIVNGKVALAGSLLAILVNPPTPGDTFLLIDNDSNDPVGGTFQALPEGASVTFFHGPDPYTFEITYTGGDGNDVVLNATDCPPDLTNDGVLDNADLSAFVTLYLAGDLAADFTNDGFLDNGDISAFIAAFLAGC